MLKSIRLFLKVAELGSFSKAAKVLNMAPSSITRSIDSLEHELKTELFKRSTRQLTLTDKGHIFLAGASKLVAESESLFLSVTEDNSTPEGTLRISVFESFGRLHICPIIPEFLKKYPKIRIEIELENRLVDLGGENVDLAIRVGTPTDSSLKARKLTPNHTLICASPDYWSKYGKISHPDGLSSHNCLLLNTGRQRCYWFFKKNRRSVKVLVRGNLTSRGGTPLLEAALRGIGVVQLSNWVTSDFVKNGQLVACLRDWEPRLNEQSSGNVYAVYRQSAHKNPNIRIFLDYLIENIDGKFTY